MKRLVLTLAMLAGFALGGVAQSLHYDFEDGTLQGWTTLDGDGDGHCWEPSIGGMGHNSNGMVMAYSRDYATGEPLTPDEYLVSPRLVLNEWPVIHFFVCALDEIYCAEHFGVSISTTVNDDPLAFTLLHDWTLTAKDAGNRQGNWYEFTVDLSAYTGQEVYVAIRHFNCTDMFAICVDDIQIDGTIQQDGLVISPDILTFEEPWVPQTFTISNQTDNVVTISSINVEPDDNVVLLSGQGLPRTLQPNETMNVEVYVNGIGYKGYLTYYVNVATSIGYRQVTVRVNEEAWDEGLLWMPMQGLTFDENSPLTQGFNLTNTNALDSITIYELYEDGTDYLELVPSHSLPYVIPPHESLYIDVTLINFPENNTNVNIYSSSSLGQGSSPYVHIAGGLTPYYPLVHEGNDRQKWNVVIISANENYPNDYHTEIQSIRDDITLDGVDYKIVWTKSKYGIAKAGAVREEDRRVYYRRKISQNYQDEVLLYDFNLNVGDTVTVNWMGQQLMVMEESEVEVNGTMRRQLGLGAYSIGYPPTEIDEYWIEGVGSTFGFLNSGSEGLGGAFITLLCYHENGNLIWDNEEFDDCVMNSNGAPATFAPQGAEWYFDVFNPWGTHPEYQRFFVEGDTIIQGHQCSIIDQRFVDTGHDGGEYVYEEDNKVYWFNPTTNAFSILYDFDAEAGESWDYEVGDCTHQVIVDSVGSVTWNGHNYRTQWVSYYEDPWVGSSGKGKIIEGVGYEKGLFPSIEVCNGWEVFDASEIEYLRCYVDDGEMLYHEGGYDCDYTNVTPPSHPEWYYEILNENGTITYQYMYQAGDTIINDEPTHILVKINTLYDKGLREEVTHEYVFELNGKLYWWNKRTHSFTVLYDYEAEVGDSWNIMVGIEPPLTMTVDAVDYVEYEGRTYRVMHVSDPDDLFSGDIICGIGHLTSFFPERLMRNADGFRVEGLRCYWVEDELVFNPDGEEECDAIYSDLHGIEEDGPSTGTGTFAVYPNPTNGILTVHHSAFRIHHSEFQIANLMGQTVLSGSITAETMQIDVSNLPEGMYFISIGGETRKFVVR